MTSYFYIVYYRMINYHKCENPYKELLSFRSCLNYHPCQGHYLIFFSFRLKSGDRTLSSTSCECICSTSAWCKRPKRIVAQAVSACGAPLNILPERLIGKSSCYVVLEEVQFAFQITKESKTKSCKFLCKFFIQTYHFEKNRWSVPSCFHKGEYD